MAGCKKKVREVEFYDSSTNIFLARACCKLINTTRTTCFSMHQL
jgi:hypothetical protein